MVVLSSAFRVQEFNLPQAGGSPPPPMHVICDNIFRVSGCGVGTCNPIFSLKKNVVTNAFEMKQLSYFRILVSKAPCSSPRIKQVLLQSHSGQYAGIACTQCKVPLGIRLHTPQSHHTWRPLHADTHDLQAVTGSPDGTTTRTSQTVTK